ncbi:MAG: atoC [Bacteroidetes bacterium]|jgi:PAS domain S-box-containing protein|nr:atoC [Bacteroidota bacterium]
MDRNRINVLYIDDEPNNLISFRANFRTMYNVYTAQSGEEGKKVLDNIDINVVITDQRMPNITGVQFLESIIKDYPYPVRIILTGYSDIETVIEAINKGQVYRYILKPFDAQELKLIIENAYDLYLFRKNSKEALNKYHHLFENSNDTIFILDVHGRFKEMNSSGSNLFKIRKEDVPETDLISLFINRDEYKKLYGSLVVSESVIDRPVKLKNMNKEVLECLFSASKIVENGIVTGYHGMIRDITKQKEIENLVIRTIIETQETERTRFGKNLHDGVGSMLASIKVMLHKLTIKDEQLKENPQLKNIFNALTSTIVEMRNVCFNIMPPSLQYLGLTSSIVDLCMQYEASMSVKFDVNIPNDFPRLNAHLELAIFRIAQEFINNSLRHGKATNIKLDFSNHKDKIHIVLRDNGKGFNVNSYPLGLGIKNIKSRIQSYNGEIKINSTPTVGTEFEITLPKLNPIEVTLMN